MYKQSKKFIGTNMTQRIMSNVYMTISHRQLSLGIV